VSRPLLAAAAVLLLVLVPGCTSQVDGDPPAPASEPTASDGPADQVDPAEGDADAVRIGVDDEAQAVVDAHPPGTTFVFEAGTHRGATVVVRDGDRYRGEPGAVLTGAAVLDGFERDGRWWSREGLGLPLELHGEMDEGHAREGLRHDLYLDGSFLRHVEDPEVLGPGRWYLDVEGDRIVMADDPAGRVVELSLDEHAFHGAGTRDVTIEDLVVTRYAAPAQAGAIHAAETLDWTVRRVTATANHGAGVRFGQGTHLLDSTLSYNGQIGLAGAGADGPGRPLLVRGNEVTGNGVLGFTWFWEKGGMKLVGTVGAVVEDNVVSRNTGPGIWFDIANTDARVADNHVQGNSIIGVFWELSDGVVIEGNDIRANGWAANDRLASGIHVSNASGVLARDNVLVGNTNEVIVVHAPREVMGAAPDDIRVEGNDITIEGGFVGVSILTDDRDLYDPAVMRFQDNAYTLVDCEPCFFWDDRITTAAWRELGLDPDSTFALADEAASS
jgi:hypothetical protein